jgi:putative hemolysin
MQALSLEYAAREARYPMHPASVPAGSLRAGRYTLRFAQSPADLSAVQRLRYEVFNLELGEGLAIAHRLGRDEDEFDPRCHHLIVEHATDGVVGTYRFMTGAMGRTLGGFYSETELDFGPLPDDLCLRAVELGRACVAARHRQGRVIHLLWQGIARYLVWNEARYLFGCASVPGVEPAAARALASELKARRLMHPAYELEALPALRCPEGPIGHDAPEVPPLLESYLHLGARIASAPALDRDFGVTDFFVILDTEQLKESVRRSFFARCERWA